MKCLACKNGDMEEAKTTYFAQLNNCYVIIENVPCMKCEQCGEEFFTMSVLEKIDDILERLEKIASKIFIMDYATAAQQFNSGKYCDKNETIIVHIGCNNGLFFDMGIV